jgi:hypothetical protein
VCLCGDLTTRYLYSNVRYISCLDAEISVWCTELFNIMNLIAAGFLESFNLSISDRTHFYIKCIVLSSHENVRRHSLVQWLKLAPFNAAE